MSNPVFNNSDIFGNRRGAAVQQRPQGPWGAQQAAPAAANLEQMYAAPSASPVDMGRMTYDDVIIKTASMFAVVLVTGALTWTLAPNMPGLWIGGAVVGLVLGLVNAFKKNPSPALIMAYAAAQGVFLGGISQLFETIYPGIVVQAVLATVGTFAACLVLFRSGKVRVTPKFTRWLMIAIGGYLVFSLLNLGLMLFGVLDGWGLRQGPLGIVIGLVAVGLASAALIVDFDAIKRGVESGAPAKFAWTAAFGLVVTLVWLYVEFLRLLAILRGD